MEKNNKAVLLINLGSPDSYEVSDVRPYLNEFLMDKRVIDIPYIPRLLLVRGIIVPFRAPKSAAKYKTIWTENGSPLVHITEELTHLLQKEMRLPAYMCMRYGNPTPTATLEKINRETPGLQELTLLPLYPHYAMSSFETAVEHVMQAYRIGNYSFNITVTLPFYNNAEYISALSESIAPYLQHDYDHVLFSYHGIPERHVMKSDVTGNHCLRSGNCCDVPSAAHAHCYRHQIKKTTELTAGRLNIPENKYSFSFQSRLGRDKWLQPFTVDLLKEMPQRGIKKLVICCPAFVIDCLETLEEIDMEAREIFMEAGGESFSLVPCLNLNPAFVKALSTLVNSGN
jgi:ferrochelatase